MMKQHHTTIVHLDDDKEEKELFEAGLSKSGYKFNVEYFQKANDAIEFLKRTKDKIFAIISDMNMPDVNGLEFKKLIDTDNQLRKKAIPFIFISSSATPLQITRAYDLGIQGYFEKPFGIEQMADIIDTFVKYWSQVIPPL